MNSLLDVFSVNFVGWKFIMWEVVVLEVGGLLSGEDNKDVVLWVIC